MRSSTTKQGHRKTTCKKKKPSEVQVEIINDGVAATVLFGQFPHAMAAWSDLNGKQLAGINGAKLRVECPQLTAGALGGLPALSPLGELGAAGSPGLVGGVPGLAGGLGAPFAMPGGLGLGAGGAGGLLGAAHLHQQYAHAAHGAAPMADPNKKFTCRLEIGIENEKEYRVGSKVIQIARRIWEAMPAFQDAGGKTRLRGKGVGQVSQIGVKLAS